MSDKVKIKICGLKSLDDIKAVNEAGADFAGFIFYSKSRRYIDPGTASLLKNALSSYINSVGVFVDEKVGEILRIAESGIIDLIQLHGNEDDLCIEEIKKKSGLPVIKAFRVATAEDIKIAEKSPADYILLDNGAGGTGESFDWTLLNGIEREYFLAGGLNPENVAEAVTRLRPWAVDVSSGVETDRKKDYEKILKFCMNAR